MRVHCAHSRDVDLARAASRKRARHAGNTGPACAHSCSSAAVQYVCNSKCTNKED